MARMLNTQDSATRCVNSIRRHQRLTKQVVNDQELISAIQPSVNLLQEKVNISKLKEVERENAYDDLILNDRILDDSVRTIFEKCKQYDRDNPAERVLVKIFPDETFGEIVRLPFAKEISEVRNIAVRIENLGQSHSLFPLAAKLQTSIETSENTILAFSDSIRELKLSEAEVDIAKEDVIRKYEHNYLLARQKYGRVNAEKLFPKLYSSKSIRDIEEESNEAA